MDDQNNQGGMGQGMPGMPGMVPPPPPPPPMGGLRGEDPHEKIMASLARIEEKLAAISVKLGV